MTRLTLLSTVVLASSLSLGAAQQAIDTEPTEVRFVHASPNAQIEELVVLDTAQDPAVEMLVIDEFSYRTVTPFESIAEGTYELRVRLTEVDGEAPREHTLPQTLSVVDGTSVTVAIIGLVAPEIFEEPEEGFLAWLQDLFTADPEDPALRALILDGTLETPVPGDEADLRIVHAAPGTERVDLVLAHANDTVAVLESAGYAEASGYVTFRPEAGTVNIHIAGSDVSVAEVPDEDLQPGARYTIMLTGTPIEDVPLEVLLLLDGG